MPALNGLNNYQGFVMKIRVRTLSYYWLPVVIYCGLIFVQSSHPMPETIPHWPLKDKLLHFVAYAVLGALCFRALKQGPWEHRRRWIMLWSVLFAGLYGASDEWHQSYVPSRSAELGDLVADFCGAVCGVWLYDWVTRQYPLTGRL